MKFSTSRGHVTKTGGAGAPLSGNGSQSMAYARRRVTAFTLMEVMIAAGLFFLATFAILGLVSNTLRNARRLQQVKVDAGMVAAQLSLTNKLYEGVESGDFGDIYRGYSWEYEDNEVMSNGLHQVDFVVRHRVGHDEVDTHLSILLFRPESPPGRASGSIGPGFR